MARRWGVEAISPSVFRILGTVFPITGTAGRSNSGEASVCTGSTVPNEASPPEEATVGFAVGMNAGLGNLAGMGTSVGAGV